MGAGVVRRVTRAILAFSTRLSSLALNALFLGKTVRRNALGLDDCRGFSNASRLSSFAMDRAGAGGAWIALAGRGAAASPGTAVAGACATISVVAGRSGDTATLNAVVLAMISPAAMATVTLSTPPNNAVEKCSDAGRSPLSSGIWG